jgi:glyoxylase-like metal-dependent hydrolase (beta-lactamase superfamily II)
MAQAVKVGNVEVVSLLDVPDWHIPAFFPEVSPELWETYRALYPAAQCDGTSICTSATAYALRAPSRTVLVDAGLGPGPHQTAGGQTGRLLEEMRGHGLRPEDIDLIIITHLHHDHVGWAAVAAGDGVRPTFPNARYFLPQKDWEHFTQPDVLARSAYVPNLIKLYDQGVVDLVSGERTVTSEVSIVPSPGHTPGHQSVFVLSQGERAAIIGDMAHTPAQVEETDWRPRADLDPALSARTRHHAFDRMEAEHTLLCAGHFPHPGFGYLLRAGGRRVFEAL